MNDTERSFAPLAGLEAAVNELSDTQDGHLIVRWSDVKIKGKLTGVEATTCRRCARHLFRRTDSERLLEWSTTAQRYIAAEPCPGPAGR